MNRAATVPGRLRRAACGPAVLLVLLVLAGCAGGLDYDLLGNHMRAGNCSLAAKQIEDSAKGYGKNQRLLFYLDAAQINMLCGNYEKSNEYLHSAEELTEELYTKSVTRETAAFFLNDYTKPYAGEDFERALINLFSAINYLMLGQLDEALVECRRLDANLSMFNDKYEQKNVYKEDAFGRYLSGIIYEAAGSLDDAFIDYFKAYSVFKDYARNYGTQAPPVLVEDLMRTAEATGRREELKIPDAEAPLNHREASKLGRVVLIHLNGRAPVKEDDKVLIPLREGPITLAFPKYAVSAPRCRESELVLSSEPEDFRAAAPAYLVEDINAIAVKNLDDRKLRVVAKTIARAVVKEAAIRKATQNDTARLLMRFANVFIERADTRSWRTLPGEIYITRLYLPPGQYQPSVKTCGGCKPLKSFRVKAGETKFLLYETIY